MNLNSIQSWKADIQLSQAELIEKYKLQASPAENIKYGQLQDLRHYRNPVFHPGAFYFQGDRLALLYLEDEAALEDLQEEEIEAAFGKPDLELNSRAGKTVNLLVYLGEGLAFACDDERVHYLEVFTARDENGYRSEIYLEPGVFHK